MSSIATSSRARRISMASNSGGFVRGACLTPIQIHVVIATTPTQMMKTTSSGVIRRLSVTLRQGGRYAFGQHLRQELLSLADLADLTGEVVERDLDTSQTALQRLQGRRISPAAPLVVDPLGAEHDS